MKSPTSREYVLFSLLPGVKQFIPDLNYCALYHEITSTGKTLLFIGILAQAVAINMEHANKEETERASSLRGFKSDHIENFHWTTNPDTGYHHWHDQGHGNGRDRNSAALDYSLTLKELLDTALASKEAATRANELANAAAVNDDDAVKEAIGKLNSAAYLAKAEAELACAYLPAAAGKEEDEEDDKKLDINKFLQNISYVEAIANVIAQEAKMTSAAAEQAVVGVLAPEVDKNLVRAAVFNTKNKADKVAAKVQLLITLMIDDAGPNDD